MDTIGIVAVIVSVFLLAFIPLYMLLDRIWIELRKMNERIE